MENARRPDAARDSAKLTACSACAGDYEDPDRTAPREDAQETEEDREPVLVGAEGFLSGEPMPLG